MPHATYEGEEKGLRGRGERTQARSDSMIRRATVREVAGVMPSRIALDAAVESLMQAGFDVADIDVLDTLSRAREQRSADLVGEEIVPFSPAPRRHHIAPEDIITTEVVVAAVAASIGGIGGAFVVVGSGGGFGWATIAAAVAALLAGGIGFLLTMLLFRQPDETEALDALTLPHGFVLWVRVRDTEQEEAARHVLLGYGAQAVRLHEIELVTRQDDIAVSLLRPDPRLGDERLGDT
jgi:hypothetical protein